LEGAEFRVEYKAIDFFNFCAAIHAPVRMVKRPNFIVMTWRDDVKSAHKAIPFQAHCVDDDPVKIKKQYVTMAHSL
jgi:hypothetical protein